MLYISLLSVQMSCLLVCELVQWLWDVVLGWILCTHKWWFSQIFPSDLQVGHILAATLLTHSMVLFQLYCMGRLTAVLYLLCIMESKCTINLRCWCCIYFALNLVLKNWYSTLQQHQKFLYNILCAIANSCITASGSLLASSLCHFQIWSRSCGSGLVMRLVHSAFQATLLPIMLVITGFVFVCNYSCVDFH